jgi:hypothetical protein
MPEPKEVTHVVTDSGRLIPIDELPGALWALFCGKVPAAQLLIGLDPASSEPNSFFNFCSHQCEDAYFRTEEKGHLDA